MFAKDSIHRSQTYSSTLKFLSPMEALKNAKQLVHIFHVETDTVVADENGSAAISLAFADFDDRFLARAGIFNSVGKQIGKFLFHQSRIALNDWELLNAPLDVTPGSLAC